MLSAGGCESQTGGGKGAEDRSVFSCPAPPAQMNIHRKMKETSPTRMSRRRQSRLCVEKMKSGPEQKEDVLHILDLTFICTCQYAVYLTGQDWTIFIKSTEVLLDILKAEAEIPQSS